VTRLLVTGFGPFPLVPRNPSGALARAVARHPRLGLAGIEARALVLETAYGAIDGALRPALAAWRPDAVLMIGVAARRRVVCVEVQALNRASRLFPDAGGRVGAGLALAPDLPLRLRTRAPAGRILRALLRAGLPARASRDAGRYLCNASYFALLAERVAPAAFVHVPMPRGARPGDRRPSMGEMEAGLVGAALALAAGSRLID
jgi:pyroglutamyl-peptidase